MIIYMRSAAVDKFQGKEFDALELARKIDMDWLENVCVPTGRQMPDNVACVHRAPTIVRHELGLSMMGRDYVAFPVLHDMEGTFKDVYEERDTSGKLVTWVTCAPEGLNYPSYFSPHCEETFVNSKLNALVQVSYHKKYFPEWRAIRDKVTALTSGFAGS